MQITRSEIYQRIIPKLKDLIEDWDMEDLDDEVDEDTQLIDDLGLTSVEFVDLFVSIERDLGKTVGFHDLLMVDGQYITDLSIGQLTDYLDRKLNSESDEPVSRPGQTVVPTEAGSKVGADTVARFRAIIPTPEAHVNPARKNKRAVFLLSAPRSGSTLTQAILAGHPNLFAPPELHLLWFNDLQERKMVYTHDSNKHLVSGTIRAMMELDGLTVEQATAFMEQCESKRMTTAEFYHVIQERLGDRLLVDKTPSYAYNLDVLKRAELDFEDPLYFHLVRHPCGMTRSFTDAKLERTVPFMVRNEADFSGQEFAELAWLTCNQNIAEFLKDVPQERQYRVHFEDLVSNPQPILEGMCRFLGLEPHPDMADPYRDKGERMADGVGTVSQMSGDLKFHLHGRIDSDAADRWRQFTSEDMIGDVTWEFAQTLGYKRES